MKTLIKNKNADSKLLSIWWFLILTIIAVSVVLGASMFFSNKIDVRLYEADILASRISTCLVSNGNIELAFLNDNFNIFEKCGLNKGVINSSNYYFKLSLISQSGSKSLKEIISGNSAFEKDCEIRDSMLEAKTYPRCIERKLMVLGLNKETLFLTIKTGSNYEFRLKGAGK